MGSTLSAVIRIRNYSDSDITSVLVYDFDGFDFGYSRPDKAFNKVTIPRERCVERIVDFSVISTSCPFSMKFTFKDDTEDVFRMNYRCVFDGAETNFKHLLKSHSIQLKKTGPRVLEIIVENTQEQKDNQKAELLMYQGCKLMDLGMYNEASAKFMEAAVKASDHRTKIALQKHSQNLKSVKENSDEDKQAKTLNNEGMQLLRGFKLYEALKRFEEALRLARNPETKTLIEDNLKIAKDAKSNQEAKILNQEGLLLRKEGQNEAAVRKFDEALRVAVDGNLITLIKRHKAETRTKQAKETLEEAWLLESDASDEAIHKFAKAKFLFQEADSVKLNPANQQSIALIDCKIEGDKCYSTAVQLENEGSRLIGKTMESLSPKDCKVARNKYEEAWTQYKEAQKKFEGGITKGDRNFERCVELADQALHGVENILEELAETELEIALLRKQI